MLGKKKKLKKLKTEPSFLLNLYKILSNSSYHSFIHWGKDGCSIIISDPNGLTKKVLPQFYNHHNFSSFVRQLNMYNFHKIRDYKDGEYKYVHSEFHKDKTLKEIQAIKRKKYEEGKNNSRNSPDKSKENINHIDISSNQEGQNFFDNLDEIEKIKKIENIIQNKETSNLPNEKIMEFLFHQLKERYENQKNIDNQVKNLIKQNNNLAQQLQICNEKLMSQNDFCKKMKGLVIFLFTLVLRKKQNYKICRIYTGGKKEENQKDKKNLVDFIFKYLDFQKNKNQNSNNNIIIMNKENEKNKNNEKSTIQQGENFSLNQNDLFKNLKNENLEGTPKDLDLSASFSKSLNFNLDLKNSRSLSSLNGFNSGFFSFQKK